MFSAAHTAGLKKHTQTHTQKQNPKTKPSLIGLAVSRLVIMLLSEKVVYHHESIPYQSYPKTLGSNSMHRWQSINQVLDFQWTVFPLQMQMHSCSLTQSSLQG